MKDWQNIRKSDEEFMKGIYERASQYEETQSEQQVNQTNPIPFSKHKHSMRRSIYATLSVAATSAVVLLGAVKVLPLFRQEQTEALPEKISYQPLPDERRVLRNGTEEDAPVEAKQIQVKGIVDSLERQGDDEVMKITLDADSTWNQESEVEIIVSSYFYEELIEYGGEEDASWLVGQKVLLHLEKYNWLEYYKLVNGDELYLQDEAEDGTTIYRNLYDEQIIDENKG